MKNIRKIKLEWLDDMVYMLRYYDNDMIGLKKELINRSKLMAKNKADREQITNILYDIWCDTSGYNGTVKKIIHQIAKHYRSYTVPLELYRCMLALTFPAFSDMIRCISKYAENNSFFTQQEIISEVLNRDELGEKNDFLKLLSFEIDHNFVDRHKEINYEKLVGDKLWQSFLSSGTEYSLQYRDRRFKLSDKEFIYGGVNLSRTAILAAI